MCKRYLAYKVPSNEFSGKDVISGCKMESCPCGRYVFVIVGKYKSSSDMLSIKKSDLSKVNNVYRKLYELGVFKFTKTPSSDDYCPTCHSYTKEKMCLLDEEVEFEIKVEFEKETVPVKKMGKKNRRRNKNKKKKQTKKSIEQRLEEPLHNESYNYNDGDNYGDNYRDSEYFEGDSLPFPKKTKEELDAELDMMVYK